MFPWNSGTQRQQNLNRETLTPFCCNHCFSINLSPSGTFPRVLSPGQLCTTTEKQIPWHIAAAFLLVYKAGVGVERHCVSISYINTTHTGKTGSLRVLSFNFPSPARKLLPSLTCPFPEDPAACLQLSHKFIENKGHSHSPLAGHCTIFFVLWQNTNMKAACCQWHINPEQPPGLSPSLRIPSSHGVCPSLGDSLMGDFCSFFHFIAYQRYA